MWYSSSWSYGTLRSFRRALAALLTTTPTTTSSSTTSSTTGPTSSTTSTTSGAPTPPGSYRCNSFLAAARPRPSSRPPLPPSVATLLRHWQGADVPLARARAAWLDACSHSGVPIANWKRREDRLGLSAYWLTGQLLEADVGSVVMFAVPKDVGELVLDESCLQVRAGVGVKGLWSVALCSVVFAVRCLEVCVCVCRGTCVVVGGARGV